MTNILIQFGALIFITIVYVGLFLLYMLPFIIAISKDKKQKVAIGIFNFLMGWSIFGWFAAIIWAFMED